MGDVISGTRAALALLVVALVAVLVLAPSTPAWVTGPNLVVNGNAEAAPTTGWTSTTGTLSRVQYGTGGYPDAIITSGGTFNGGTYLFWGGNTATMVATQTIILSAADRTAVAAGGVQSDLSAYIGGFASQGDNLVLRAEWRDAGGNAVMTQVLDPVTNTERLNRSGFLPRQSVATIPSTATRVVITIIGTRLAGTANDGYIDNISLRLVTGNPPQLSKAFDPSATAPNVPVRMTFTIANPDPQAVNDWTFTDDLPAGLVLATPVNASTTCPGTTITATGGSQSLLVSGGVAASSTCTIGVDVVSATTGTYVNGASNISAINLARPTTPATLIVARPDLSITKVASTTQPLLGETFTYELTVENHGPSSAAGVTVNGTVLGSNVELLSATSSQGSCAAAENCQLGTLDNGDIATITVTARATGVGATDNTAIVSSNTGDSDLDNNSDTETVNVQPVADLSITKVASTTQPLIGDTFSYELTVHNNGPSSAAAVTVSDIVAGAGVELISATPSAGSCSTAGSCQLGTIANDDTVTITVTARASAVGTTDNTATVSSSTEDTVSSNDSDTETVDVQPVADLSITKSATITQPRLGDLFTYELIVKNSGPSSAAAVAVSDVVAGPGVELVSASSSTGSCSTASSCQLGTMANGDTVTITVTARATAVGATDNTATVSSDTVDTESTNDSDTETVNVQPVADLSITKSASSPSVRLGDQVTYELTVRNNGPSPADNVTVSDTAAAGLAPNSAIASQGSCSSASACELGTLAVGQVVTIQVVAGTTAVGTQGNTAQVASTTAEVDSANNTASATVVVEPHANLRIVKTASDTTLTEGDDFFYRLTITNAGPSPAVDTAVSDSVPAGVSVRSVDSSRGSCSQADPVVCQLGDLASGATATITIHATATQAGSPVNSAIVSSTTPDPDTDTNQDETQLTTNARSDVSISKTASTQTLLKGESFTYTLTVRNDGPSVATGTVVTDRLPDGLRLDAATSSKGSCSGAPIVVCQLGSLARGHEETIRLTVTAVDAGTIDNSASVTSEIPDPDPDDNIDDERVEVSTRADVAIEKTAGLRTVVSGETVLYGLVVTNKGPNDAASVTVTDPVRAGMRLVSAEPSAGSCSTTGGVVVCDLGELANGAAVTIRIEVVAEQTGTTRNVASVTTSTPDPEPANDQDETEVTTEERPGVPPESADVSITKAGPRTPVKLGGRITYTLTIRNAGPNDARGVVVTDPIPEAVRVTKTTASSGSCTTVEGAVVCQVGDLPAGATATVTITADAIRSGHVYNVARVTSSSPSDPDLSNNSDDATGRVEPGRAKVSVAKSASRATAKPGSRVRYRIVVRNRGDRSARSVTVCDRPPAGLAFARHRGARLRKGAACWTIPLLGPNRARTFKVTARMLEGAAKPLVNVARVKGANVRNSRDTAGVRRVMAGGRGGGLTG